MAIIQGWADLPPPRYTTRIQKGRSKQGISQNIQRHELSIVVNFCQSQVLTNKLWQSIYHQWCNLSLAVCLSRDAKVLSCCINFLYLIQLARVVGIQVSRRSEGRLAMTLVATISDFIFFSLLLFSIVYFSQSEILGFTPFQTPLAILGPPSGHFGFCRQCSIAGGKQVPLRH